MAAIRGLFSRLRATFLNQSEKLFLRLAITLFLEFCLLITGNTRNVTIIIAVYTAIR